MERLSELEKGSLNCFYKNTKKWGDFLCFGSIKVHVNLVLLNDTKFCFWYNMIS